MSYAEEVGERLRRLRLDRGLSLQDVERSSGGRWKAAVVGSYERGDRNISAARLLELADFYGVSPARILPGETPARTPTSEVVVLDLERLERLGPTYQGIQRYVESIQLERGDFNRRVLSIRGDDLRALAVIQDTTVPRLLEEFRVAGVIAEM